MTREQAQTLANILKECWEFRCDKECPWYDYAPDTGFKCERYKSFNQIENFFTEAVNAIGSKEESEGCDYCNPNSDKCEIYKDSLTNDPYIEIKTNHWDEYNDDWDYERIFINYCPYCGRKLCQN